jgi:agmatine deiminase
MHQVREEDRDHPIGRISHQRLEENYRILADETDQDGNPFTIVRIPLPPIDIVKVKPTDRLYAEYGAITFRNGQTFEQILAERRKEGGVGEDAPLEVEAVVPASYCNFLISNGVVLMPRYYAPGRSDAIKRTDDAARDILQAAFPAHKIVQIDSENVNFGGGGIHCITQQQPLVE